MYLKEKIKERARKLGLPIFGVTTAEPLSGYFDILEQRKQLSLESPFERNWHSKNRCSPQEIMPDAQSAICVGLPYFSGGNNSDKYLGIISRYAWGRDYHLVMKEKLQALVNFLCSLSHSNCKAEVFVDSVPLLEKVLAVRAGLGWIGKNSLLYNQDYGSWFYLGEILTDVILEPDTPVEGGCGSCSACISACPTGALIQPYALDANRCLSCVTQVPGLPAPELREKMGTTVFGCDRCQEVCPQNCQVREVNFPRIRTGFGREELWEIIEMPRKEFNRFFKETCWGWVGKSVISRNAIIVLANAFREGDINSLTAHLSDPDPEIRAASAWALGQNVGRCAAACLRQRLLNEEDDGVCREITRILESIA